MTRHHITHFHVFTLPSSDRFTLPGNMFAKGVSWRWMCYNCRYHINCTVYIAKFKSCFTLPGNIGGGFMLTYISIPTPLYPHFPESCVRIKCLAIIQGGCAITVYCTHFHVLTLPSLGHVCTLPDNMSTIGGVFNTFL